MTFSSAALLSRRRPGGGTATLGRMPHAVVARDEHGTYDADPAAASDGAPLPASSDPEPVGDLRAAVRAAMAAIEDVHRIAAQRGVSRGGELGGLIELLRTLDRGHAAAIELVDRIESESLAERHMGMPLEWVLGLKSQATYGDRRFLQTAREVLRHLPNVKSAFDAGLLGWGQVRAIVTEARPLTVALREDLDARFADQDEVARLNPDELVDHVQVAAQKLRGDLERKRTVQRQERRYFHMQPSFEGGVRGNFDLPAEEGALVVEALNAAAARPTGDRDVTADAPDPTVPSPVVADSEAADGGDEHFDRPRARQLADAFVRLAEAFLAGQRADGTTVRARPTMLVSADIRDLIGDSESARRARLLWRLPGAPPALTPDAVRRLSNDADLQFVLTDGHEVLGISAPTSAIPARLRRAVVARDRGCRFPGCQAPAGWTDLHHLIPREREGPTTLDNLVCICRRHHMAVTEGRWRLAMARDGTVTVRRGRHRATSDPPLRRHPLTG